MIRTILTVTFIAIFWSVATADSAKIAELEKKLIKAQDTVRVNTLLDLSVFLLRQDAEKADSVATLAYEESVNIHYLKGKIRSMIYLGNINSFKGDDITGANFCKRALFLSDSINDMELLAESYDLSYLLYYRRGIYDSAGLAANIALEFATNGNYKKMLARGNQNLGILNSIRGNHSEAIRYFLRSEKYYEEMGDEFALALLQGNIGVTFEEAGNYPKALEYMHKDLTIGMALDDDFLVGNSLVNIGAVHSQMNQWDSAIVYYQKSLFLAEKARNYDLIIINLDNIGSYHSNKTNYDSATFYLKSAYELAVKKGFDYQNVYIFGHLAQNYLAQEKYDSALVYAQKQLQLATDFQFQYDQKLAYENLSKIYAAKNEYKKAHEALLNYTAVNDSLFNNDKTSQIENLREQYESEKKEQEIENLKATNEKVRYRNISYAGAAISFLILGGLLYYVQRMRTRRNRLLLEKEIELDRLKSRFFANVSHEFRTPLTLILGPLDALISKIELPDMKKQLKVMKRNAERLLDLVNQLLDLSKIESGKLQLSVTRSDIISVIRGVSMSFHSMAEQKHIDLKLDVQPDHLELNYDREKLETIMTNLLSNAFKFTPVHGQIAISTLVQQKKDINNKSVLNIEVSDSGSGISEEEIHQIFDRFYQSDHNQLLQQEGSGIGLALTKEFVELHGGMISAKSQPGKGTQFRFTIPMDIELTEPKQTIDQSFESEKAFTTHEANDGELERVAEGDQNLPLVLLIEDHMDVRNYIREILGKRYRVLIAEDGEKGVSIAYESIPDLIISDVMMPKKDGFEVCRELKQDEKTSHIPIILLTAKSESEDKIEGLETQADDYVTKPFVPKELLARIKNLIDSSTKLREKYKSEGILRPRDVAVNSVDELFLNRMVALVESNMGNELFGVEQLGNGLGMSRSQLHRKLTALIDQGPNQFIRTFRLQRAHDLLKQKAATASEIAYQVGFSSPSYFTKCFHDQFGYTPSEIPG